MTGIALYWASGSLGLIENYRSGSLLFHLALILLGPVAMKGIFP